MITNYANQPVEIQKQAAEKKYAAYLINQLRKQLILRSDVENEVKKRSGDDKANFKRYLNEYKKCNNSTN